MKKKKGWVAAREEEKMGRVGWVGFYTFIGFYTNYYIIINY